MIARSIPRMPIVRGNEPQYFTTKGDAGIFAIEILTAPKAKDSRFFTLPWWSSCDGVLGLRSCGGHSE